MPVRGGERTQVRLARAPQFPSPHPVGSWRGSLAGEHRPVVPGTQPVPRGGGLRPIGHGKAPARATRTGRRGTRGETGTDGDGTTRDGAGGNAPAETEQLAAPWRLSGDTALT